MTALFGPVLSMAALGWIAHAVTDLDQGRTFLLNPDYLPWEEARQLCQAANGSLAKIDQLHVVPEMAYSQDWTLWVGLRVTSVENLTWEDGTKVDWTNWHGKLDSAAVDVSCVAVITSSPYSWVVKPCTEALPSVCEIPGGNCRFIMTEHASLQAYNNEIAYLDQEACLLHCETTREMDCRSVEINRNTPMCQLSTETRWTKPRRFIRGDRYWDYHQWTCINGEYWSGVDVILPNGVDLPTLHTDPTTPPTVTSTYHPDTTDQDDKEDVLCLKVKPVTLNATKAVEKEVKELQSLSQVYKEHSRLKKKISTPDARPSATYMGSLAVALVVVVLVVIVCMDVFSLPRYLDQLHRHGAPCGKCAKLMKKAKPSWKRKTIQFSEYPASRFRTGSIFIDARVPRNYRPGSLARDHHVETVYPWVSEDLVQCDLASVQGTASPHNHHGSGSRSLHITVTGDRERTSADLTNGIYPGSRTNQEHVCVEKSVVVPQQGFESIVHEALVNVDINLDDSSQEVISHENENSCWRTGVSRCSEHNSLHGDSAVDSDSLGTPGSRPAQSLSDHKLDCLTEGMSDTTPTRNNQSLIDNLESSMASVEQSQTKEGPTEIDITGQDPCLTPVKSGEVSVQSNKTILRTEGESEDRAKLSDESVCVSGHSATGTAVSADAEHGQHDGQADCSENDSAQASENIQPNAKNVTDISEELNERL